MAPVLLWAGCVASYYSKEVVECTLKILDHANVEYVFLGKGEPCCGFPCVAVGDEVSFRGKAGEVASRLAGTEAESLICLCPSCLRAFLETYPEFSIRFPMNPLHLTQFLKKLVKGGRIKPERLKLRVAYHDPCHLGRHCGIYDPPREVLRSIPGVGIVEMPHNRENSWCCGAGGGVRMAYPLLSLNVASMVMELEVVPLNVDVLAVSCPLCLLSFREGAKALGAGLEVLYVSELMLRSLEGV